MIASHPLGVKALSSGRVVVVRTKRHPRNVLGVVLSSSTASKERTFKTLVLCDRADPLSKGATSEDSGGSHRVVEPLRREPLFQPDGPCGHTVLDLVGGHRRDCHFGRHPLSISIEPPTKGGG